MWSDCTGECWFTSLGVTDGSWLEPMAVSQATGFNIGAMRPNLSVSGLCNSCGSLPWPGALRRHMTWISRRACSSESRLALPKAAPSAPHLHRMLDEYYALAGWDLETGVPSKERLAKVGLTDYKVGR